MIVSMLEIAIPLFALFLFLTQILIPKLLGQKTWPLFSSKRKEIDEEIEEIQDEIALEELRERLEILREQQERIRKAKAQKEVDSPSE